MSKVLIIGAGLGGLSCAIYLAYRGFAVTIVEKQATVGGKLQRVETDEFISIFNRQESQRIPRFIYVIPATLIKQWSNLTLVIYLCLLMHQRCKEN